jgi:hypothetical protein
MANDAALLANVHRRYWDVVSDIFVQVVNPSLTPDLQLRRLTQWRRSPWGVRVLENESPLGMSTGTPVPQIVIDENIRSRASRGAGEFCVPESFSLRNPIKPSRERGHTGERESASAEMLAEAREMCREEFGDYPKLAQIECIDDEWVWRFRNHPDDHRPSTVARGDNRKLLICGKRHSLTRDYFLPDSMTAQELGEYLAIQFGIKPPAELDTEPPPEEPSPSGEPDRFARFRSSGTPLELILKKVQAEFREPISDLPISALQQRYREKLPSVLLKLWPLGRAPAIIQSGEGLGKSTTLSADLLRQQFEAFTQGSEGLACIAFRSRAQARDKVDEFRQGRPVQLIETFWSRYQDACRAVGVDPIARDEFEDIQPGEVLTQIREQQPKAFDDLERTRQSLWSNASFDSSTLLVTTHRAAALWRTSVLNRAWHHPKFKPDDDHETHRSLASSFIIDRVVFDDPEVDDFVERLSSGVYQFMEHQQSAHRNWKNRRREERLNIYHSLDEPLVDEFERFDELMRLDLATLDRVAVDFDAISFGKDQNDTESTVQGMEWSITSAPGNG